MRLTDAMIDFFSEEIEIRGHAKNIFEEIKKEVNSLKSIKKKQTNSMLLETLNTTSNQEPKFKSMFERSN